MKGDLNRNLTLPLISPRVLYRVGVRSLLTAQAIIALIAPILPAAAAETQIRNNEDIIVTAQRREEAGQDVPIALTVFSGDDLRQLHISSNRDLITRVPSLMVSANNQTRSTEAFTLRGQGTTYQASQGVVMYMAETPLLSGYVFSSQGGPGQFLDLESLQVLKGAQGTLFGRNTTGGAILLAPARPTKSFGGYVQAQVGNYDSKEIESVINFPVVQDKMWIRGAFRRVRRDGITKNIAGRDRDDENYWTGRIGVTYRPTASVENYLIVFNTLQKTQGSGFVVGAVNPALGLGFLQPLVDAQTARGPRIIEDDADSQDTLRTYGLINVLEIGLNAKLSLRNITSYSVLKHSQSYNYDGFGFLPNISEIFTFRNGPNQYQDNLRQVTEELQLQGTASDSRLQYALGVYSERIWPDGPNQVISTGLGLGLISNMRRHAVNRRSTAVYGQASFDFGTASYLLRRLRVTAGFRYTWDKIEGYHESVVVRSANPGVESCGNSPAQTPPNCRLTGKLRSDAPSWLLSLDYKVTPDLLAYAKFTEGYKAGGFNAASVNSTSLTFQPEFVRTLEAGLKAKLRLGGTPVIFNAGTYSSDYSDIQRAAVDFNASTGSFGARTINAATARIRGVEADIAITPISGLNLSASYAYTNADYRRFDFPTLGQRDCSGSFVGVFVPGARSIADLSCIPFPFTARNQFAARLQYVIPLPTRIGSVSFGAQYAHQGKQYTAWTDVPGAEPGSYLEPVGLLTLTVDWRNMFGSPFAAQLFATNALNKTYRIGNSGVFGFLGFQNSIYGEPRMLGVRFKYDFGE